MPPLWLFNNGDDTKIKPRHTNLLSALPPSHTPKHNAPVSCVSSSQDNKLGRLFWDFITPSGCSLFSVLLHWSQSKQQTSLCALPLPQRESRRSSRVGAVTHEYFCVATHRSIIDVRCWIKTIRCRNVFSLHLHMSQRKTSLLLWVNSPPRVTALNIHDVPLHNLPCQQKERRGE